MYANVHVDEDAGHIEIRATAWDLKQWAARPDCAWPCSTLARCENGLAIRLDIATGDLFSYLPLDATSPTRYHDVAGDELTAFCDDALEGASKLLLAAATNSSRRSHGTRYRVAR